MTEVFEIMIPAGSGLAGAVGGGGLIYLWLQAQLAELQRRREADEERMQARLAAVEAAQTAAAPREAIAGQQITVFERTLTRVEGKVDKLTEQMASVAEGQRRDHEFISDVNHRVNAHLQKAAA